VLSERHLRTKKKRHSYTNEKALCNLTKRF